MQNGNHVSTRQDAREVIGREKILLISPQVPEFDKYAGWARLSHLVDILSRRFEVFFVAEDAHSGYEGEDDRYTQCLKEKGVRLFIEEYQLDQILLQNRFKLAIIEFFAAAERNLPIIRGLQPDLDVVLDTVDVHFLREQKKAELTQNPKDLEEAKRTKIRELEVCRNVEAIFAASSLDKEILHSEDANLLIEVIPTVHPIDFEETNIGQRDKSKLLFVGGFKHPPNVDAVRYFCREILPLVHERHPDIELFVVGEHRPEDVEELAADKVKFLGYVPDLKEHLQSACISVAPLRYGGGMKGKIGEALGHGLPVVTTGIGVQGLTLTHGEDVLVADTPEAFAGCIHELLSDEDLYTKLARNGPEFIRRTCTPELVEERLVSFIEGRSSDLLRKRIDRQSRQRYDLTFDTFQRYQMTADILGHLEKGAKRVLDVGDSHGVLRRFLPDDYVVAIDRDQTVFSDNFVVGDAAGLPFCDGTFDFIVSMDALEHVPRNERKGFIDELVRAAGRGLILGAPFHDSMTEEGEILVNELHRNIYGKDNPWLSEHRINRLPDLEETVRCLESTGLSVAVLPNGYLLRWLFMLGVNNFLAQITNSEELLKKLNAYYNRHCYLRDNVEPCYRYIIVALRGAVPPKIEELYPEADRIENGFGDDLRDAVQALHNIEILRFLHENEAALRKAQEENRALVEEKFQLGNQIILKDGEIANKDREIAERDAVIANLLSKWPVRIFRRIKSLMKRERE